jgi:hypothetical protein
MNCFFAGICYPEAFLHFEKKLQNDLLMNEMRRNDAPKTTAACI